jgi:hypothetical protein
VRELQRGSEREREREREKEREKERKKECFLIRFPTIRRGGKRRNDIFVHSPVLPPHSPIPLPALFDLTGRE